MQISLFKVPAVQNLLIRRRVATTGSDNKRLSSNPDVITIVKGGLGNQLFIYAAGRAFAERLQANYYLDSRRGFTHDCYGRRFLLDRFPVSAAIMPEEMRVAATIKHMRHKLARSINKLLPLERRFYLAESHGIDAASFASCRPKPKRVYLNGHWGDESFFKPYADLIHEELRVPAPEDDRNRELGAELKANPQAVFIHVRRVRYISKLKADYYKDAIDRIRAELDNPRFVVFSDDMTWARENFPSGLDYTWVEHNQKDELADLWLMSCCRHAIIANSSFSWWGAWLGPSDAGHRIIYSPDNERWPMRPAEGWRTLPFEI